jgi:hypothetical protein
MRIRTAALTTGLMLVLGGCTGGGGESGDFQGDEQRVAEAVDDLQAAVSRQDNAGDVCRDMLSRDLAARLNSDATRCEQEIRLAVADADLFRMQIVDIEVEGTSARARVRTSVGDQTTPATLELVEERGNWRLDGIGTAGS